MHRVVYMYSVFSTPADDVHVVIDIKNCKQPCKCSNRHKKCKQACKFIYCVYSIRSQSFGTCNRMHKIFIINYSLIYSRNIPLMLKTFATIISFRTTFHCE